VDTHVGRLAERLRLCWNQKNNKDAIRIERDLMEVFPRRSWTYLSHALIWHGRRVCTARKPDCPNCVLRSDCPSADMASVGGEATGKPPRTGGAKRARSSWRTGN